MIQYSLYLIITLSLQLLLTTSQTNSIEYATLTANPN